MLQTHTKKEESSRKHKPVHLWMTAQALSAWYIHLWKGTEKTSGLLNMMVLIKGFQ